MKKDEKSSNKEKKIEVIMKPSLILKSLKPSKSYCIVFLIAFKSFECLIYKIEKSFQFILWIHLKLLGALPLHINVSTFIQR